MINITDKKLCSGCTACASVCPKQCIEMCTDEEGFLYPRVDKMKCIECDLCENICPVIKTEPNGSVYKMGEDINALTARTVRKLKKVPNSYACYIKNDTVRKESTSGGFFSAIAQMILNKEGVVFGVIIDSKGNVMHQCASNIGEVGAFRGSKYVQSNQCGVYEQVKKNLDEGRWVLYTGTPCQVAGLKSFLRKPYEKLVSVDIFCHGVGSPLYWEKYRNYMEEKYGSKIQKIRFREKTYGYNSACMAVYFENGNSSHKGHDDDLYWSAFSKCMIFRPSCYSCHFKSIYHEFADFSIGDFWDTNELGDVFKQADGCSLVLVHSEKAKEIFNKLSADIVAEAVDLEKALIINGGWQPSKLFTSSQQVGNREQLFKDLTALSLDKFADKYIRLSVVGKFKCAVKPWLYLFGLLEKIKKLREGVKKCHR